MLVHKPALMTLIFLSAALCAPRTGAQDYSIDTARSHLKLRVFKSGLLSAFAHNHEIEAPITAGMVHLSGDPSVVLKVHARELRVLDPEVSAKERADVQRTMESPEVLDVRRFPEISFQSTAVQKKDDRHWAVRGKLALHGQTAPVEVDVVLKDGYYEGSTQLRQHDFGMVPVSIAGGTVKVKDEVRVDFRIVLRP